MQEAIVASLRAVIDLHCHILAGIDDGPADSAGSRSLAEDLSADGVTTVAATPHLRGDHPAVKVDELADRCAAASSDFASAGIPLTVVPGAEVDLLWAMDASPDDLRLASFGQAGAYVLVETPYGPLTSMFERLVYDHIMLSGLTVLLAHPERSPTFQEDPDRLSDLVSRGVLLQVTAPALVSSDRRSASRKLARALVSERRAHGLASDSHGDMKGRPANLGAARDAAAEIDQSYAEWLVTEAPAAILAGERLPPPPEKAPSRRRRLWPGRTSTTPSADAQGKRKGP
jgi:protein-tyrosine phosphatase